MSSEPLNRAAMYTIAIGAGALVVRALMGLFTELLTLRQIAPVATALVFAIVWALTWHRPVDA